LGRLWLRSTETIDIGRLLSRANTLIFNISAKANKRIFIKQIRRIKNNHKLWVNCCWLQCIDSGAFKGITIICGLASATTVFSRWYWPFYISWSCKRHSIEVKFKVWFLLVQLTTTTTIFWLEVMLPARSSLGFEGVKIIQT
jgi:hypothetical protein